MEYRRPTWSDDAPDRYKRASAFDDQDDRGDCQDLLDAAKAVLATWNHGDLAAAVRQLAAAVEATEGK